LFNIGGRESLRNGPSGKAVFFHEQVVKGLELEPPLLVATRKRSLAANLGIVEGGELPDQI
jgi:hypothetical protein